MAVRSVRSVVDNETGTSLHSFAPGPAAGADDIVEFIWEYVEYTYENTAQLRNVIGEATAEIRADGLMLKPLEHPDS